jgi:hypothetical protein
MPKTLIACADVDYRTAAYNPASSLASYKRANYECLPVKIFCDSFTEFLFISEA